ncbi:MULTISPECIES: hypothetical protein [Hydrocarboniphaga]|uniref:Uncharacterized protein n=1 Tax=Hydrocarboniphaga effusa AP103 TaxID=1172194 RepID=I8T8A1_9GAMM|nr:MULTISPECIES: hypothetical protein [Hydrocarboniphaga]EIT69993.1 hypothetical protein WQQ_01300 [Hydrocarboniphaga effusa AP103]EIT70180.1 hypothetical protein WQQ_03170 [Hydrocarboniphaga effusa AP103]MDZ4077189.1 hypothetical protein [Hydrocarboniphaga sp.]
MDDDVKQLLKQIAEQTKRQNELLENIADDVRFFREERERAIAAMTRPPQFGMLTRG